MYKYLPSFFAMLIIGKVILNPFVDILQCHPFLFSAINSKKDKGGIGKWRFGVWIHGCGLCWWRYGLFLLLIKQWVWIQTAKPLNVGQAVIKRRGISCAKEIEFRCKGRQYKFKFSAKNVVGKSRTSLLSVIWEIASLECSFTCL